jgi:hypothetical protein
MGAVIGKRLEWIDYRSPAICTTPNMLLSERIDKSTSPEPMSGCWLWTGTVTQSAGHASIRCGSTMKMVHRLNYARFKGTIPAGIIVRHKCDIACCVNPDHLILGTPRDNSQDRVDRNTIHPAHGSRCHAAKWTDEKVIEIRRLYEEGWTLKEIGVKFGVWFSTISGIVRRKSWRHVK